jgi:LL-diaminopimelate aminotransferase
MSQLNHNYQKLQAGYLFPEIGRRVKAYASNNPDKQIIRLGIGDTVRELAPSVITAIHQEAETLANQKTYTGYGDSEGTLQLRQSIKDYYKELGVEIDLSELFVSDGAKSDCANIQNLFEKPVVALQDPAYPVYVDSNVIAGNTGESDSTGQYQGLVYLQSSVETNFLPQLPTQKVDLIYLCFPNNPTGAVATREYLQTWVDWAIANKAVIIYDAAYSWFIQDSDTPKSIYEIPGSKECAIEIQSFSKFAGFTGVRLGWTVVPFDLKTSDSEEKVLNQMWTRRQNTFFNGASNLAQAAGVAALSETGRSENQATIDFYMENAKLLKECIENLGLKVLGGHNAPYVWLETPTISGKKLTSWEFFDYLLNQIQVVSTPGSGFGPSGEGWIRLSSFGLRENVLEGIKRLNGMNLEQVAP